MKGWKEGNLEAYTQATKEWEEATKKTIENNNLELEKYRMVIEDKKLNIDQMSAALNVVSTETGNKVLFDQTMAKNFTGYLNTYDKMISSQERLKLALDKSQGLDEKSQAPLRAGVEEAIKNPDIVNKWDSAMYLRIKGYADTIGVKIPDQVSPKGSQPRSAPAMALQQFIEEKRKAGSEPTSQEIADFNAHQQGQLRATRDFATGKQGQQINSLNVGISHLETLRSLGDALKNGSVKRFNEIAQKWAEETGNPAPTNFDTAKDIVGAEVMKAIVVGGGGVTERNAIRDQFARAGSPAAIGGAIDTAEKLLAGQFVGLKRQYEQTTGQTDFDSRMTDEALSIYQKLSPAGGAASVSDGGKPKQVIQNGHTYDLQPDGSYK
jgi:hypothetical protein